MWGFLLAAVTFINALISPCPCASWGQGTIIAIIIIIAVKGAKRNLLFFLIIS